MPTNLIGLVTLTYKSNKQCIPNALPINYILQVVDKDFTATLFLELRTYLDQDAITALTPLVSIETCSIKAYSLFAKLY